jgi:hypothetical protein
MLWHRGKRWMSNGSKSDIPFNPIFFQLQFFVLDTEGKKMTQAKRLLLLLRLLFADDFQSYLLFYIVGFD